MDVGRDIVDAFACIAEHLADLQLWEAAPQSLETRDGLQVIVAISGDERRDQ